MRHLSLKAAGCPVCSHGGQCTEIPASALDVRPWNGYIVTKSSTIAHVCWIAMKSRSLQCWVLFTIFAVPSAMMSAGETTVFNFLRNDVGARAAALAGSYTTIQNDPDVLFYNPAGLATVQGPEGSIGFFKNLLDINAGHLSYTTDIEGIGRCAAGIVYTNYGSFDQTDALGNAIGSFSANDIALSLGYAFSLEENLYLGGAVKLIYSGIADYTSTGVAADLGILYTIPESRFAVGANIRNLGTQISAYNTTRERLPLDVGFGASVIPKGLPLLLNVGFHRVNDEAGNLLERFRAFTVGGEFTVSKVVLLRFGYDNARRKDFKIGSSADLAGFSAGLGILVSGYNVDYGLSSLGKAGILHRISLRTSF